MKERLQNGPPQIHQPRQRHPHFQTSCNIENVRAYLTKCCSIVTLTWTFAQLFYNVYQGPVARLPKPITCSCDALTCFDIQAQSIHERVHS